MNEESDTRRFSRDAEIESARRPAADTRPDPGVLETIGAGFQASRADTTGFVEQQQVNAYKPVIDELLKLHPDRDFTAYVNPSTGTVNTQSVWRDVERQRAGRGAFGELPATLDEFEQQWRTAERKRIEGAEETASRGNAGAAFVGGVGGALTDPINIWSLPVGGVGKTIGKRVLTEGLANAGIEALTQPVIAQQRRDLGRRELTPEEAGFNIVTAAVAGAALRGGIEIAPAAARATGKALRPVVDKIDDLSGGALTDRKLARAFAQQVPEHLRTPEQEAALMIVTRQSLVEEASPFVRTMPADDVHAAKLTEAMAALESGRIAVERVSGIGAARQGSAAPSRSVAGSGASDGQFDMAGFLTRTRGAESSGDDAAAAQTSSAFGRFQFLKDTWLEFYRKTFGDTGESRAAILGKRADGAVQDQVMEVFTRANIRALERAGVPVRDNTVYLAHFLGQKDAIAVMRSAPGTPIAQVISSASIAANRAVFDDVRTAGELAEWAARKFDGAGGVTPVARSSTDATLAALDAEDAMLDAQQAALGDVEIAQTPLASRAASLDRSQFADDTSMRMAQAEQAATVRGEDPATDPLFRLRQVVSDRDSGQSLNRTRALAQELGMSEAQLRQGLTRLASLGEIRQNANGNFTRIARPSGRREDLLLFIARQGGITPDGLRAGPGLATSRGHDLRNTGSLNHFVPGGGPLLRPTGKSLDDIGELIHEAGFLGPPDTVARPTESEVIALLDRVIAGKERLFADGGGVPEVRRGPVEPGGVPRGFQDREEFASELERHNRAAMSVIGRELTEAEFLDVVNAERLPLLPEFEPEFLTEALWESGDLLVPRVMSWVNRQLDEAIEDAFYEVEDEIYAELAESTAQTAGRQIEGGAAGGARQAADAGDAGQGGARAGAGPGDGRPPQLNPRERDAAQEAGRFGPPVEDAALARAFDADDGEGVRQIAESDWHDIRADLIEPAAALREAGEGVPVRPTASLLEADGPPKFDLDDGLGPRSAAEIDAEITAQRAGIEEIRNCLK